MKIIEEEDTVIVVQNEQASVLPIVEGGLVQTEHVSDDIYDYAIENTDYSAVVDVESIDWPLEFEEYHHLEDALYQSAIKSIEQVVGASTAEEIFNSEMNSRIDKPEMELGSAWELYRDGSVELRYIEYDGVKFTPE